MHWDQQPVPPRARSQAIQSRTRRRTRTKGRFMESPLSFFKACIGTMNPRATPLTPSLSPSEGGEGARRAGEGKVHGKAQPAELQLLPCARRCTERGSAGAWQAARRTSVG